MAPRQGGEAGASRFLNTARANAARAQNPGNPEAEKEFMKIGNAYERLADGKGGDQASERQRQQQEYYRRQQQQQYYGYGGRNVSA